MLQREDLDPSVRASPDTFAAAILRAGYPPHGEGGSSIAAILGRLTHGGGQKKFRERLLKQGGQNIWERIGDQLLLIATAHRRRLYQMARRLASFRMMISRCHIRTKEAWLIIMRLLG